MRVILALLTALTFGSSAVAASLEDDVAAYITIFSGDESRHSNAADSLSWMGLSDTRLFDIIEKELLADYVAAHTDRSEKNRVARYIRGLGFSGQPKYAPTLQKFVGNSVYDRYAREALRNLPAYQKWNPAIANRSTFDPKYSDDANRVMNMLRSDDLLLKRVGAKRIYFGLHEDYLLDSLEQQVRANALRTEVTDSESRDSIAWMVKALGSSKKEKYKPLILEIAQKSKDPAVVRHAKSTLERDYRMNTK